MDPGRPSIFHCIQIHLPMRGRLEDCWKKAEKWGQISAADDCAPSVFFTIRCR